LGDDSVETSPWQYIIYGVAQAHDPYDACHMSMGNNQELDPVFVLSENAKCFPPLKIREEAKKIEYFTNDPKLHRRCKLFDSFPQHSSTAEHQVEDAG